MARLKANRIKPTAEVAEEIGKLGFAPLQDSVTAYDFLKRPEVHYENVVKFIGEAEDKIDLSVKELIETEITYEGYIKKSVTQIEKMHRLESKKIPDDMDWDVLDSIATEARQMFKKIRPETLGQASRIPGVNPADISILMVYLESKRA